MAKSKKKKPKTKPDLAQNAFRIVQEATGQAPKTPAVPSTKKKQKGRNAQQ